MALPIVLSDIKMPWFGSHSGYERLVTELLQIKKCNLVIGASSGIRNRAFGKIASLITGYHDNTALSGRRVVACGLMLFHQRPLHILYGEMHLLGWSRYPRAILEKTLLTLHQPLSAWSPRQKKCLARFRSAIVLSSAEADSFRELMMPGASVKVIPHGADTEFFSPGTGEIDPLRIVYSGVHLRNAAMLARIVPTLLRTYPGSEIHLLVPSHRRSEAGLASLHGIAGIHWHEGLDDHALRSLYRSSCLMLLPMNDSSANNAVVEALACGLPVITTDVGGIRDYGGGDIYPLIANNDDEGMIKLAGQYLQDQNFRNKVSKLCRDFAVRVLSWKKVALAHSAYYSEVFG